MLFKTKKINAWQKFVISKIFFIEINTFIQQGHIKVLKSDFKDIYNVTKHLNFK